MHTQTHLISLYALLQVKHIIWQSYSLNINTYAHTDAFNQLVCLAASQTHHMAEL